MAITKALYDSKLVSAIVNGRFITGLSETTAATFESTFGDTYTATRGSQGDVTHSKNAAASATIFTLSLMHTSTSINYLRELYASGARISIAFVDKNEFGAGEFTASGGFLDRLTNRLNREAAAGDIAVKFSFPDSTEN